jgi:epoxyqueuosine reductase
MHHPDDGQTTRHRTPEAAAGLRLRAAVEKAALGAGLHAIGVTDVRPFDQVRRDLEGRRASGLHGGMSFTYRNPGRSTEPERLLRRASSLVVGALGYAEPVPGPPAEPSGRVARYAWRDHYAELRAGLAAAAAVLRAAGHRATVVADDNGLVDRAAAHRAGIGWWGRNSNLLIPGFGSWFVIGSVVTDAVLPVAEATVPDGCRSCTRCVPACPTGAIVDHGVIDARRCLAWLVQAEGVFPRAHRVALGDRLYGCDDCQDVCPPGRATITRSEVPVEEVPVALGRRPPEAWVPVADLLRATDDELLARHGRWYVPARDPRYLRRNALVVLGNIGSARDPDQRRLLARYVAGPDALLRAHAVWAAARLGLDHLVDSAAGDPEAVVRAEVALAPAVERAPGAVVATAVPAPAGIGSGP